MYPTYVSRHSSNRGNQIIPIIILSGELLKLSVLLKKISSKHKGDFYCQLPELSSFL